MARWVERVSARRGAGLVGLILVVGLALTAWLAAATQREAAHRLTHLFDGHVDRLQDEIISRIQRAEYGLRGTRAALSVKPDASRDDFRAIVESRDIWREFRGVRGFGFIERIDRRALRAFEAARRAEGARGYQVRTGGKAPDLFVIKYIEPLDGNLRALGYDLGSDPVRRESLELAAMTGEPTLTPRLVLLQDERRGAGLVYLLPVYTRDTAAPDGGSTGRLVGFVHAPIVVAEILGDLQSFVEFMLDIRLYEGLPADGRALYDSRRHIDPGQLLPPDDSFEHRLHVTERQFGIGGRLFTLQVASKPAMEASVAGAGRASVWFFAGGTLLTLLMAFAASLLLRGRTRAVLMAQRITADLEQASGDLARSNERLSAVMEGLRESESLMRLITDNIPGRIVYWDPQGRCRFANRDFLAGHGVSAQQAVGCHWSRIYGMDDPLRARRVAQALSGQHLTFEKLELDAAGRQTVRMVHYVPHAEDGEVRGFFALGLDITELRTARDNAVRASEAKSRFVANMSHELRTPMNAVLGMLQLMQLTTLTTQQQDYAAKAEGAARALLSVLNDILDFSKVEAGKMTLDPREFELDALLRDLSVIFAASIGAKPVEFLFEIDPAVPGRLVADDMRLRQVLINLGGNAIKFTEAGEVRLRIALADQGPGVVTLDISLQDTGIGIAAQNLRRLFEDFGQAEASTTRRFGGTGLGLAISRKLVALMGGELGVDSELGRGSCFCFRLTVPVAPPPAGAGLPLRPGPGGLEVLVADGRECTADLHAAMARSLGWRVTRARTGDEALALAAAPARFDAVLVDWMLDREVPLEVARQLGEQLAGQGTALVVLGTGEINDLMAQLEPARQRHIGACLTRPVTPQMLAHAVGEAQARVADPPAQADPPLPAGAARPLAGLRLLVAEDNENNQMVARELLTAQGARIVIAGDGMEAVARMREDGRFDAILMDWQMPRMDGLQACAEIRALGFDQLPIIAMTANAMESDRSTCLAAGMNDHVAKPFVLRVLVEVLLHHTRAAAAGGPRAARGQATPLAAPCADPSAPCRAPAVLDRAGAIEQLGGSAELYEQLVPMFRLDVERTLAALADVAAGGAGRDAARRQAHTLKGTAGTVGARELAQAAREVEAALSAAGDGAVHAKTLALALETLHGAAGRALGAMAHGEGG